MTGEVAEEVAGRATWVIGHQGGWDEILLVAGPIALIAMLLWVADRRSRKLAEERLAASDAETSGNSPGTS